jgi:hypothetical protein
MKLKYQVAYCSQRRKEVETESELCKECCEAVGCKRQPEFYSVEIELKKPRPQTWTDDRFWEDLVD